MTKHERWDQGDVDIGELQQKVTSLKEDVAALSVLCVVLIFTLVVVVWR